MSNPFREATRDVTIPELATAIHVSDLLLLSLRAKVLTEEQYDQIRVRFDAVVFPACSRLLVYYCCCGRPYRHSCYSSNGTSQ